MACLRPTPPTARALPLLAFLVVLPAYYGSALAATCTTPAFTPPSSLVSVQNAPANLAVGDWNKDGFPDFAVTNTGSNSVSIRLGNGTLLFPGGGDVSIAGAGQPVGIAAGDFDGDAYLDLAVAARGPGLVRFLQGGPGGTFTSLGAADLTGRTGAEAVVAADFNRDGKTDLAVASTGGAQVTFYLRLGAFTFAGAQTVNVGQGPASLVVGDFDRDGDLDVAAANSVSNDVSLLLNNGSGVFTELNSPTPTRFSVGQNPRSIAAGDFDRDGRLDLVTADLGSNQLTILRAMPATPWFAPVGTLLTLSGPAWVMVSDFDRDGLQDLAVSELAASAVSIRLGTGPFAFGPSTDIPTPSPLGLAAGDFNRDGRTDFLKAFNASSSVGVFLNDSGFPCTAVSFSSARAFDAGTSPLGIVKGDFDNDGRLDIVVSNDLTTNPDGVSLLRATGAGRFASPVTATTGAGTTAAARVAAGDFDGDGKLDVLTGNGGSNNVTIMPGAAGGFGPPMVFGAGAGPVGPVVGDFDGDGKLDFAVSNTTSGDVTVYLKTGAGFAFGAPITYPIGASVTTLATGDLNGDGRLDLVAGLASAAKVAVLLGQSSPPGSFGPPILSPPSAPLSGSQPETVALGDWNGDSLLDAATANETGNNVSILRGNGDGTFNETQVIAVGTQPEMIVAEDFNGDGRLDLATSNIQGGGTVSVILSTSPGSFGTATSYPSAPAAYGITAGDFTGDGQIDLMTTNSGGNMLLLYVGNGSGGFGVAAAVSNGGFVADATEVADINRDDIPDLVTATAPGHAVRVLMGDGTGAFPTSATTPVGASANVQHAVPGDFDRDGFLDVVVGDIVSDTVQIWKGNGSGSFSPYGSAVPAPTDPFSLAVADFDRNGTLDVAAALTGSNQLAIYLQGSLPNPLGTVAAFTYGTGTSPDAVVAADFDGDLVPDLAVTNQGSNTVTVRKGQGDGSFAVVLSTVSTGNAPFHLVAGDFDRDGDLDLVVANNGTKDVTFLKNSGGSFTSSGMFPTGGRPTWIVAGDFNRDGFLDVATANTSAGTVSILLGDGSGSFALPASYGAGGATLSGLAVGDFDRDGDQDLVSANALGQTLSYFSDTNCASRRFELVQSPSACNSPSPAFLSIQPRLRLTDDGDNLVQCDAQQVTASVASGGGVLGGGTIQSALGGNVNYTNLSMSPQGIHYSLAFTRSGANPPIPARTPKFTVDLTVDVNGPASVCAGSPSAWTALAPPFVSPPVYDKYLWSLGGTPLGNSSSVTVPGQSPGGYVLQLDATIDGCTAIKTRPFTAEDPVSVSISVASGSTTVCTSCSGATMMATETGGGTVSGRQWGYRTTSGGLITNIPGMTFPSYTIQAGHFLGGTPGQYYLVETSTASCGGAVISNEIPVTVYGTTAAASAKLVFTVTSTDKQNVLEWRNPPAPFTATLVKYNKAPTGTSTCAFPATPGDGTLLTSQPGGGAGSRDSKLHDTLENDTAYCYTAFVEVTPFTYAVPGETRRARPFDHTAGFVKWALSTGATTLSPPGMGQNVIHVVSNDGSVHAIKKGAGGGTWADPPWMPPLLPLPSQTGRPGSIPITAGGQNPVMFVSSQDGHLYAFGATNGVAAWATPPPLGDVVQAPPSGVFTAFGGTADLLFVGTRNSLGTPNTFYALRLADGGFAAPGWAFTGGGAGRIGPINGQAAVDYDNHRVYFASWEFSGTAPDNNTLWCVDFDTGLPCGGGWPRAYGPITGGVAMRGTTLYVGLDGGGVRAIDAATGASNWVAPFSTSGTVKGFVYPDRLTDDLYFSTASTIYSVSDLLGTAAAPNWGAFGVAFTNGSTPVFIPNDDKVYVGGNNRLFRRKQSDGSALDEFVLGDPAVPSLVGSPTIDLRDGFIYVGTDAGVVYAIRIP
jgi:hypothetical protein